MKSTLVLCALVVGTFTTINASAQERAGILDGASSYWISRGGSTKALKNSYLGRFDEEKRRNDAAIFNGGWVRLHDFNTTTKDSFKRQHLETQLSYLQGKLEKAQQFRDRAANHDQEQARYSRLAEEARTKEPYLEPTNIDWEDN